MKYKNYNFLLWAQICALVLIVLLGFVSCGDSNHSDIAADEKGNGGGGPNQFEDNAKPQEKLDALLSKLVHNDVAFKKYPHKVDTASGTYSVNNNGMFVFEDKMTRVQTELNIVYDVALNDFVITDAARKTLWIAPPLNRAEKEALIRVQRSYGIFNMKTNNRACYYNIANQRLTSSDPYEQLLALERSKDPRPLLFKTDDQWNQFRAELVGIFKQFKDPHAYIVILGTSTTFFSENPEKGENQALLLSAPACDTSNRVYTFDTPGKAPSDLDVHFFIPSLSKLCQSAGVGGNFNGRATYHENTIDKCLIASPDSTIHTKVKSELAAFLTQWDIALNHRNINVSVRILPGQKLGGRSTLMHFNKAPEIRSRFTLNVL